MSNRSWIRKAKKRAAQLVPMQVQGVLFVPEFVRRAAQLGLSVGEKPLPQLPAPSIGDPGMLEIRSRAKHAAVRAVLPGQRVVGRLQQAAVTQHGGTPIVIDPTTFLTEFAASQRAGRTQLTVREFERLLALPYQ